jgi:arsenite methyltransferase
MMNPLKKYLSDKIDLTGAIDVFDEVPLWSAPFGLKILEYIEYKPNISVIDIGFGAGFPLTEIALRLGNGSKVYGIDPWKEAIERVNRKIFYYQIRNIELFEGVAENIPLKDNSIDLIVSNNGLNNVQDLEKSLSECYRIMKKGGQFVMTVNLEHSMFEFYNQLEIVLKEMKLDDEIEKMHQHITHKRKPLDELVKLINKHGFAIKDLEHDQFDYRFAHANALFSHYFIRLAFMDSWIEFLPSSKLGLIFDKVEKRLDALAKAHGVVKLSIPFVVINSTK